jgi:hypothetical protein
VKRTSQLKVLISNEELRWLKAAAEKRGVTMSAFIRDKIRQDHAALVALKDEAP